MYSVEVSDVQKHLNSSTTVEYVCVLTGFTVPTGLTLKSSNSMQAETRELTEFSAHIKRQNKVKLYRLDVQLNHGGIYDVYYLLQLT